jgi:hypothetical protein
MKHDSDTLACEIYSSSYNENDDAIVGFYRCTKCGREFEVSDPSEEERNCDYADYWNN